MCTALSSNFLFFDWLCSKIQKKDVKVALQGSIPGHPTAMAIPVFLRVLIREADQERFRDFIIQAALKLFERNACLQSTDYLHSFLKPRPLFIIGF